MLRKLQVPLEKELISRMFLIYLTVTHMIRIIQFLKMKTNSDIYYSVKLSWDKCKKSTKVLMVKKKLKVNFNNYKIIIFYENKIIISYVI